MTSKPTVDFLPGHDGISLAVHRLGVGSPVLLLHGLSSNATMNWIRYGTAQRIADAGFEAIMVEQRVHGQSASPQKVEDYPADVMALDMEAIIAALDLGAFDLVGYSMGSRLSTSLVQRGLKPQRLVLGGMGLEGLTNWQPRRQFFLDALDRFEIAKAGDRDFMAIQFMKTVKIDPVALRLLLLTMPDVSREALSAITMPTLVLCGADDNDNGSADALVAALPDAQRGTIPGNHMSCITLPQFGEAIASYLVG